MAIYRTVSMTFWTDSKVTDDFTPEDRYFYLYLFTNPHTNLSGCYEISLKQMSVETGYSKDSIENLLKRFEKVHDVIRYSEETKEILLVNWHKYNWTGSPKFRKPLEKEIQGIKSNSFRVYLQKIYDRYGIDTNCIDTSVTDTDTNNIISNNPSVDNYNLSNDFSFNAEKAWNDTFAIYPKKEGSATAKQIWMDKLLKVIPQNQQDMAQLIYKAVQAYLEDYRSKQTKEDGYKYVRRFDKWLTEDCDYWISVVEKGEREC